MRKNGDIKSRAYVDGSSQQRRPRYKEEDCASPTVLTDGVFITRAVKAWEEKVSHVLTYQVLSCVQIVRRETRLCCYAGNWLSSWYLLNQNCTVSMYNTQMIRLIFMSILYVAQ